VRVLHFAEGVAYKRIQEARAARRHPQLLDAIRRGDLHVTAASLLVPQLSRENLRELIGAARHRTAEQVRALLAQVRKRKLAEGAAPRPPARPSPHPSRAIPAAIRREVARRDAGRCTYLSKSGRRCGSREFLEFHHVDPWEESRSHSIAGITLRCRAHNQYQAESDFGARHMAQFRKEKPGPPPGTGFESGS
jgi:5-methylcytosine-specific restriction endonuclease McrA